MRIDPAATPTPAAGARAARRGRRSEGDFSVPGLDDGAGEEASGVAAGASAELPAMAGLSCLLPLDIASGPAGGGAAEAGQAAVRHGSALLGALAGLQLAGLGGDGVRARQTLADLARALPESADPQLDEVLRAIAQRAAIELARAE